jgi:hypothetical protein
MEFQPYVMYRAPRYFRRYIAEYERKKEYSDDIIISRFHHTVWFLRPFDFCSEKCQQRDRREKLFYFIEDVLKSLGEETFFYPIYSIACDFSCLEQSRESYAFRDYIGHSKMEIQTMYCDMVEKKRAQLEAVTYTDPSFECHCLDFYPPKVQVES